MGIGHCFRQGCGYCFLFFSSRWGYQGEAPCVRFRDQGFWETFI